MRYDIKLTLKYGLSGGILGYAVLHPLVMIVSHLMFEATIDFTHALSDILRSEIVQAFSANMLGWKLAFTTFGGLTGYLYGKVKQEQKDLQEANAVKAQLLTDLRHSYRELDHQHKELHRAQHALKASNQRYADLYNFAPVGYATIDRQGRIVAINLTGADMLNMRQEHLLNRLLEEFVDHEYQDVFYLHRRELFKTQTPQKCDIKLVKKNSDQFYARLESVPVRDDAGNIEHIRVAIVDIHDRKVAEEALWNSEFRYTTLFNSASDAILIYELTNGQILDINQAACDLLGYTKLELWVMTILDIDQQNPLSSIPKQIGTLPNQDHVILETGYGHKDGRTIPVEVSSRMIEYKETPAMLCIARDMNERKYV